MKQQLIKEFDGNFMNNGLNGVLPDEYQDPKMLLIKKFIEELYDKAYEEGYLSERMERI